MLLYVVMSDDEKIIKIFNDIGKARIYCECKDYYNLTIEPYETNDEEILGIKDFIKIECFMTDCSDKLYYNSITSFQECEEKEIQNYSDKIVFCEGSDKDIFKFIIYKKIEYRYEEWEIKQKCKKICENIKDEIYKILIKYDYSNLDDSNKSEIRRIVKNMISYYSESNGEV